MLGRVVERFFAPWVLTAVALCQYLAGWWKVVTFSERCCGGGPCRTGAAVASVDLVIPVVVKGQDSGGESVLSIYLEFASLLL